MHQLYTVINDVEKTHLGLGNALAFAIICAKAKMCLLFIAPSGCGKSVITETIASKHSEAVGLLSVTKARLKDYTDMFSNFNGVVLMDDMSAAGSLYERKETLVAFSALCYSHFISKHTLTSDYEIRNFFGAAILNTQPSILAEIYQFPEWESIIQDKTIRYYHLYRPTKPEEKRPEIKLDWGIDLDLVSKPDSRYKLYSKLEDIAAIQWSDARIMEHLSRLLKATAALARRQEVKHEDFLLLHRLIKPMTIERHIMRKSGFETGRWMEVNLLDVLVEFASWKDCNIKRIARDYKISENTVYRLLGGIKEWFASDESMSKQLIPRPELVRVLREAGVRR